MDGVVANFESMLPIRSWANDLAKQTKRAFLPEQIEEQTNLLCFPVACHRTFRFKILSRGLSPIQKFGELLGRRDGFVQGNLCVPPCSGLKLMRQSELKTPKRNCA